MQALFKQLLKSFPTKCFGFRNVHSKVRGLFLLRGGDNFCQYNTYIYVSENYCHCNMLAAVNISALSKCEMCVLETDA